jgi:hypothetical protein
MIDLRDRCAEVDIVGIDVDPDETTEWAALIGNQRVQGGLPAGTALLWKVTAKAFPQLSGAGAWGDRSHQARKSDHNDGYAVDFMTTNKQFGDRVLAWLLLHRFEHQISYIIWWGRIYSPKNGWKGARYVGRSAHKDHLHVSRRRVA